MTQEEYYIRSNVARLEAKLKELMKHERVYPLLIAKVRRDLENERKRLEETK